MIVIFSCSVCTFNQWRLTQQWKKRKVFYNLILESADPSDNIRTSLMITSKFGMPGATKQHLTKNGAFCFCLARTSICMSKIKIMHLVFPEIFLNKKVVCFGALWDTHTHKKKLTSYFFSFLIIKNNHKNILFFKACVCYFHQIFIFSPNDYPSKTMKNAFYFI